MRLHDRGAHHVEAAVRVERGKADEATVVFDGRDPVADDFFCIRHDRLDRPPQRIQRRALFRRQTGQIGVDGAGRIAFRLSLRGRLPA